MTNYILTRNPDFVVDEEIVASHKWQTAITWASEADHFNPDLIADKLVIEDAMVNSGRLYAPPILMNNNLTGVRRFPTEADAQYWVDSLVSLAAKHNSGIDSAVITELP